MMTTPERERMIYQAVWSIRDMNPEPVLELCLWCNVPVDPDCDPYCSMECAICAENDDVD